LKKKRTYYPIRYPGIVTGLRKSSRT